MAPGAKILVIDDESGVRKLLGSMLGSKGFEVQSVSNAEKAIKAMVRTTFDLVITDLRLPGMQGQDLVAKLKKSHPALPVVVISAYGGTKSVVEVIKQGAEDYVSKPFMQEDLDLVVYKALEKHRLLLENERLRQELGQGSTSTGLIGASPAMRKVQVILEKVATGKGSVLITGESGTGKELAARAIHSFSSRKNGPFIDVNAGAIPANLFEAELFGAKKGAYTGSTEDRAGLFEMADKGTLFLDEVGELPMDVQAKLLRVLESGEVRAVGDSKSRKVDVRVISATNQDLQSFVERGRFRKDLYYRLSVLPLKMPSVRERMEDVPLLTRHFLKLLSGPKRNLRLDSEAMKAMMGYSWPGNVREIKNILERAALFTSGAEIGPEEIIFTTTEILKDSSKSPLRRAKQDNAEAFERQYLLQVLKQHDGNVSQAARVSGLDRRNLQSLLRKHHINPSDYKN